MPTEEQLKKAEELVDKDPARAAYQLADVPHRLNELEKAMEAIRAFSQNTWMASSATKEQVEAALGRKF